MFPVLGLGFRAVFCDCFMSYVMAQEVILGLRTYVSNLWRCQAGKEFDFTFTRKLID